MTVYHQVLKTAYRKVGRFFMPAEKYLDDNAPACDPHNRADARKKTRHLYFDAPLTHC